MQTLENTVGPRLLIGMACAAMIGIGAALALYATRMPSCVDGVERITAGSVVQLASRCR